MELIPLARRLAALGAAPPSPRRRKPAGGLRPIPLARRIAALQGPGAGRDRSFFTGCSAYFRGLSVLTGSPEPERKAEELAQRFKIPPNMRLTALVRYAFSLSTYPGWEADANDLLYSLLIEPYTRLGCLPAGGRLLPEEDEEDSLPF